MDEKQQDMQQKFMQVQMLNQQIQQLQKHVQMIDQQLMELTVTSQALDDLGKTKEGTEILVPINAGIFAKAGLKNTDELVLNVGSSTAVTKDIKGAKDILESQIREITKAKAETQAELQQATLTAQKMQMELQG